MTLQSTKDYPLPDVGVEAEFWYWKTTKYRSQLFSTKAKAQRLMRGSRGYISSSEQLIWFYRQPAWISTFELYSRLEKSINDDFNQIDKEVTK